MKLLGLLMAPLLMATSCLSVPDGLQVVVDANGCLPGGEWCAGKGVNGYSVKLRTIFLEPNYTAEVAGHELCHAHQHRVVLDSLGREPSESLREWYLTPEGRAYIAVMEPSVFKRPQEALEEAAWVCSWFLLDQTDKIDSRKLAWAETWLR